MIKTNSKRIKFSVFKIIERFKEVAIYQKLSITLVKTNLIFVDTTNVKS